MISIIIPAHKEPYMQKTIDSLLKSARGDIEILPVFDGRSPDVPIRPDKRVKVVTLKKHLGMRAAINMGIAQARGEFLMKCDAHCAFGVGFDRILSENCAEDWLVIPRRYSLDCLKWQIDGGRPYRDYQFITYPTPNGSYGITMSNPDWPERTQQRNDPKYDIDDTMAFQGSCWMAQKRYFLKRVGFLDDREEAYGSFADEYLEIGLKYWLGGGQIKVIKKTWYAHLSKSREDYQKGLFTTLLKRNLAKYHTWSSNHWMNNEEPGMIHPLSWLIEKFWPVPTWPEDRSLWVFPTHYLKASEQIPKMTKLTPLCKIALKYGTDKCPQIHHSYTPFYYQLLKDKRHSIKKVLEMGIGNNRHIKAFIPHNVTGASLFMWRDFFRNAQVYGADNDPETIFTDDRIKTFLCDETKEEDVKKLIEQTGSDIDLFIDDGSHGVKNQYVLCRTLLPLLKKGVIYIIEDVRLPGTLQRWLSRLGYDCHIPQLPPTVRRKRVRDNVIFIVKPKQ